MRKLRKRTECHRSSSACRQEEEGRERKPQEGKQGFKSRTKGKNLSRRVKSASIFADFKEHEIQQETKIFL